MGIDLIPEAQTKAGRIDLVFRYKDKVYIIEYKVVEDKVILDLEVKEL